MMITQPPFPQQFADENGNLNPAWKLWMTAVHTNLKFQGQSLTVAQLPSGDFVGQSAYASNGRKAGEGAGNGTGVPVWNDGSVWRTLYDNSQVSA